MLLVASQHNWTDSWVRGFRMLEAYQAVGIPRWSQIKSCNPDLQAFTTVPEATGRGSRLVSAAKVTEQQVKDWLKKQVIWQIYLPTPRHIPRPKFDVAVPNEVHQAELLFLPHDRVRKPSVMLSWSLTSPASTKRQSPRLARPRQRSPMALLGFTSAAPCDGRSSFKLTLVASSLAPSVRPGRVAQSVGHLTRKSGVLGSIPGLATYFRFSFRFFKKGSCQLLAKVCARSTG